MMKPKVLYENEIYDKTERAGITLASMATFVNKFVETGSFNTEFIQSDNPLSDVVRWVDVLILFDEYCLFYPPKNEPEIQKLHEFVQKTLEAYNLWTAEYRKQFRKNLGIGLPDIRPTNADITFVAKYLKGEAECQLTSAISNKP